VDEFKLNNRILDNLHGFVYLTDLERDLVNTPQFQRLRRLKQLGVADLVFPGAQHTRFSHSLGVLELTERVFWNLKRNLSVSDYDPKKLELDRKKLRIAALLHDIGHYPLSHTLESAYKKYADYESNKDQISKSEKDSFANANPTKDDMHHEHIGEHIIKECKEIRVLLEKDFMVDDIQDIFSTITGNSFQTELYYTQLMHSDLDVDSLDYCLRDSYGAGIEYGKYDINFLLDNIELRKVEGKFILCFKEKAIHTIEHFLLAKHFYYLQILFHPKRLFFEEAAKRFAIEAIKIGWLPSPQKYRELIVDPIEGLRFTDSLFWELCYKAYRGDSYSFNSDSFVTPTDEMKVFSKILIERKAPKNFDKIEKRKEIEEDNLKDKDSLENFWDELKKATVDGYDPSESFTYLGVTFGNNEITGDTFGRFYNTFDVTKTTEEYKFSLIKRLSKAKQDFNEDHFQIESRDSIRIDNSGKVEFLSKNEDSLAYILAKNKIGVYVHF
jgi:HD superfamily phosphohydrolase